MNISLFALAFNMPTLLILLALALLIFGNRLPSLGKNLGKSITGFKKGLKSGEADEEEDDDDDDEIEEPVVKKKKAIEAKPQKTVKVERQEEEVVAHGEEK